MSGDDPRTASGFLRHVMSYGAVTVLMKVVALGMLPLYTRWLSESEYGAIGITGFVLVVLSELFGSHLLSGMSRQYFLAQGEGGRRSVISSTTLAIGGLAWLVCGTALFFCDELTPFLLGTGDANVGIERLQRLLTLTLLILPCQLTTQAGFTYLLVRKRSELWSLAQLIKMALELGLKILFMGFLGWGLEGYMLSVLVGEALSTLCITGAVLVRVGLQFDRTALVPIARFALPLLPVGAFQLGLHQLDRRLIEHLAPGDLGLSWAGIYSLGYLVAATPASVLLNALFAAWQPSLYAIDDPVERRKVLARDTTWTVLTLAGVCALTCLAGRPLVDLLAGREGYRAAYLVVPWVACGSVCWGLYATIQLGFYAERRTGPLVLVNFLALILNVGLNFLLIPRFGTVGAAGATLGAFALLAGIAGWTSQRICPAPLELGRILTALGVALMAGVAGFFIDSVTEDWALLASIGLRAATLVAFLGLLIGPCLRAEERELLKEQLAIGWARLRRTKVPAS